MLTSCLKASSTLALLLQGNEANMYKQGLTILNKKKTPLVLVEESGVNVRHDAQFMFRTEYSFDMIEATQSAVRSWWEASYADALKWSRLLSAEAENQS